MNKLRRDILVLCAAFGGQCLALWAWWLDEILAILPANWAGAGMLVAEFHGTELHLKRLSRTGEYIAGDIRDGEAVTLRLHPPDILFRTLKLPSSARPRLKQILGHELTRQSPLPPIDILYSGQITALDRQHRQLIVAMAILRRSTVDNAATRLREQGLQLKLVLAIPPESAPVHSIKLQTKSDRIVTRSKSIPAFLATVIVALVVLNYSALLWRDYAQHRNLSYQLAALEQKASTTRALRNEEVSLYNARNFLNVKRAQPYFGRVIAEITKLMPDNSYLIALSFNAQQVQIEGYAEDPSGFVGLFDSSSLFSSAAFSGAITQGPATQLRHFVMTMNVVGNTP